MQINDLRGLFKGYFADRGHKIIASSSLVPQDDPTLMFTNAGMVPFKNYFTGVQNPDFSRAVSSQKCVRAGGKHNDLENVGYTARHHTFFEMLGNFSFGDYFKEQAISYAWEFVHKELGLSKERLLVTVYHTDEEAAGYWKKIAGLAEDSIIRITTNDNFWSMGDTGPCGPCSEIFYDHGEHIFGGPPGSADEDGDRFVEIWNLVFMQYEQLADGNRVLLPKPSIDTGSGLERLAAVMQGVCNNYDIDVFKNIIDFSQDIVGVKAVGDALVSYRVMADHLRAMCFLIADGVSPSNEGRGYVLRRIMRRAMRHGYILGTRESFMHRLVPVLISQMSQEYPDLLRAQDFIIDSIYKEEDRFRATLGNGLKLLEGEKNKLASAGVLPGHVAFKLYDTYGFPLDLTQDILRSSGHSVDTDGFNMAMEVQKTEARKSWSGSGDNFEEKVWLEQVSTIPATDFIGYDGLDIDAKVLMIVKDGIKVDVLQNGDEGFLLLDQTTFYAESGGQMGDRGILKSLDGHIMCDVIDTSKKAQIYHGHFVKVKLGNVHVGDLLHCQVDANYRSSLQAHHSATHLLHSVLRRLIGVEITQKGSLVAHDRLRFDFSCGNPLTREQIADVEQEVNRLIIANKEVSCKLMSHESAIESGAMALFGEKYGDTVRVVSMGGGDDGSVELCGGTHVSMTGNIGFFKITSESGVASGVRRIEAVCANAAYDYIKHMADQLEAFSHLLKAPNDQLVSKLQSVLDDRKKIEKENRSLQQKLALGSVASGPMSQSKDYIDVNGFKLISRWFDEMPPKELKGIAEGLAQNLMGAVVVVGSGFGEKVSLVAHVSGHTVKMVSAVDIVQNGAVLLGGHGGGGRPDMAQAGGSDSSKWPAFEVWLKDHLSKKSSL